MKTIIKYLLVLSLTLNLNCWAQDPGDTRGLANKDTWKGKRELKRQMKVKNRSVKNAKKQESEAALRNPVKNYTVGKHKKTRVKKTKNRERRTGEPKEK
jgi:hypothetical protein